MISLLDRRRELMAKVDDGVPVELPDYIKIIKTTTEANQKLYVGYYALSTGGNCGFKDLIIDGVNCYNDTTCWKNDSNAYIVFKEPGVHTVYLKIIHTDYSNGNYFFGTRTQFPKAFSCTYLRVPSELFFNIRGNMNCDTFDMLSETPKNYNQYSWYNLARVIRVPKNSLSAYKENSNWSALASKIVGCNFIIDYIQTGLVFQLDCANATTSKWVDKIGNIEFTMHNVTIGADGGVYFNGSNAYGNYSSNLNFPYNTHTIEIVYNKESQSKISLLFMINNSDMVAYGYGATDAAVIVKSGNSNPKTAYSTGLGLQTVSVTPSTAYKNLTQMSSYGGTTDTWYLRSGGTFVGTRSSSENFFKGSIYQIRIYNRALKKDEMLFNQRIDIKKYGITTS